MYQLFTVNSISYGLEAPSKFYHDTLCWLLSPLLQVLYVVYCSVAIALIIRFVDNYTSARQFTGLQFPISTLVCPCTLLHGWSWPVCMQSAPANLSARVIEIRTETGFFTILSKCGMHVLARAWLSKRTSKLTQCPKNWSLKQVSALQASTLCYRKLCAAHGCLLQTLSMTGLLQGLALFLLLSFRTNSSYERWWEGRIVWESISCKVQDTCRIAAGNFLASCPDPCLICWLPVLQVASQCYQVLTYHSEHETCINDNLYGVRAPALSWEGLRAPGGEQRFWPQR